MMPAQLADGPAGGQHAPVHPGRHVLADAGAAARALPWRPVLLSFVAARVVVLLALGLAQGLHAVFPHLRSEGLLGWDAYWYHLIAQWGYGELSQESLRFFPLLPVVARGVAPVLLGSEGAALLVISNGAALLTGLLLHRLVRQHGFAADVADRAVWAAAFAPAAFVMVMGYTEPVYTALLCALLIALRERRWLLVAALGLPLGALRPPGVVLCVVVLVEAVAGAARRDRPGAAAPRARGRRAGRRAGDVPAVGGGALRRPAAALPGPGGRRAARRRLRGPRAGHRPGRHRGGPPAAGRRRAAPALGRRRCSLPARAAAAGSRGHGWCSPGSPCCWPSPRDGCRASSAMRSARCRCWSVRPFSQHGSRVRSTTIVVAPLLLGVYAAMAFLHLYVP